MSLNEVEIAFAFSDVQSEQNLRYLLFGTIWMGLNNPSRIKDNHIHHQTFPTMFEIFLNNHYIKREF